MQAGGSAAATGPPRVTVLSLTLSSVAGTWRVALETPRSASGTSAQRRRSSQPKVGAGCAREQFLKARRDPSACSEAHRATLGCCASHMAPSLGGELLSSTTEVKGEGGTCRILFPLSWGCGVLGPGRCSSPLTLAHPFSARSPALGAQHRLVS